MPSYISQELRLEKIGPTKITVRVDKSKVWIMAIDEGNPQQMFWALGQDDWDSLKKFVDTQLSNIKILQSNG